MAITKDYVTHMVESLLNNVFFKKVEYLIIYTTPYTISSRLAVNLRQDIMDKMVLQSQPIIVQIGTIIARDNGISAVARPSYLLFIPSIKSINITKMINKMEEEMRDYDIELPIKKCCKKSINYYVNCRYFTSIRGRMYRVSDELIRAIMRRFPEQVYKDVYKCAFRKKEMVRVMRK